MTKIIVVGAGIGGLTSAIILAKSGFDVTVYEAHVYPGGSAGTFRRKRYRFDAGATLAGGFKSGEIMDKLSQIIGTKWKCKPVDIPMSVQLPSGETINRFSDARRWKERINHFGEKSIKFWEWQERTADVFYKLADHFPPYPPQDYLELKRLLSIGIKWSANNLKNIRPKNIIDGFTSMSSHLKGQQNNLKKFINSQLFISAQTTSDKANALYSATALDLPRRGVVQMEGGIGTISRQLETAFISTGNEIQYKQKVNKIEYKNNTYEVTTEKGIKECADVVISNLSPWSLKEIMTNKVRKFRSLPKRPKSGWGAFVLYIGLDDQYLPELSSLHYHLIGKEPLPEANSAFISISPKWDNSRTPEGKRAITISTHTDLTKWWKYYQENIEKYNSMKEMYQNKVLRLTKKIIPDIGKADLIEPGTPITYEHFTSRSFGWVGGFPQTNLFSTFGPKISDQLWMVGDSIFPGQSIPAVAIGGIRVANSILERID